MQLYQHVASEYWVHILSEETSLYPVSLSKDEPRLKRKTYKVLIKEAELSWTILDHKYLFWLKSSE